MHELAMGAFRCTVDLIEPRIDQVLHQVPDFPRHSWKSTALRIQSFVDRTGRLRRRGAYSVPEVALHAVVKLLFEFAASHCRPSVARSLPSLRLQRNRPP